MSSYSSYHYAALLVAGLGIAAGQDGTGNAAVPKGEGSTGIATRCELLAAQTYDLIDRAHGSAKSLPATVVALGEMLKRGVEKFNREHPDATEAERKAVWAMLVNTYVAGVELEKAGVLRQTAEAIGSRGDLDKACPGAVPAPLPPGKRGPLPRVPLLK